MSSPARKYDVLPHATTNANGKFVLGIASEAGKTVVEYRQSFAERHRQTNRDVFDLARPKRRLCGHATEVLRQIGPFEEHVFEYPFRYSRVDPAQVHFLYGPVSLFDGCVLSQIEDYGLAARLQHPMHLANRLNRLGEVLEGGSTVDEVKDIGIKWRRGRVALPKLDSDARICRILRRD